MSTFEKYALWGVYSGEIPQFIRDFAETPAMQRLKHIGMSCGTEYSGIYPDIANKPYARFEHSVGAALIVWHFTGDMRQSAAALFHDISTPSFAHVVDFMNGDHAAQESTEELTEEFLANSAEIQSLLKKYGLNMEDVSNYHLYPIADNDSPKLSADRLEYTFGNLLQYGFASLSDIVPLYENIAVGLNERDETELVFKDREIAEQFAFKSMKCSRLYVSDNDRFVMQYLSDLLKLAIERGAITRSDLYSTEDAVLQKLSESSVTCERLREYKGIRAVDSSQERTSGGYCVRVGGKKRYIDPFVQGLGRATAWSGEYRAAVEEFLQQSFDGWLSIRQV